MRLGVIDCGTNTFHLLIVDVDDHGNFFRVHKERNYVRLGEDGLLKIGEAPFRRGLSCLSDYKKKLSQYKVDQLQVFGTEALRRATNGPEFVEAVKVQTGIEADIITGDEEARLIHLGVMQAVPSFPGKALIMDVGGGSVEFIIASENEVHWAKSFPVGVQVLYSNFHKNDPIASGEIMALENYLEDQLQPLIEILNQHETPILIGASGSFEVVEDLVHEHRENELYSIVSASDYYTIHDKIVHSTLAERHAMDNLPTERADLIVVAFVLIDFIIKNVGIHTIITSAYAMKEGILLEMMKANQH